MNQLTEAWSQLQGDVGGEPAGFVRRRLSDVDQPAVYAGRRQSDGFEAVLVEVATSSLPRGLELPRSTSGLEVGGIPTVPGPGGRTCLYVIVSDERYTRHFTFLAQDVVDRVLTVPDDRTAVSCFVSEIERWQSFLRQFGSEGLSDSAQRGLFGELWLLTRLLDEGLPGTVAVNRWKGPDRDAHDFQLPAAAVEVKTTKTATPNAIRISGVKQLDDRGLPGLFLYFVQVEESATAELSLPELIGRLRDRLDEGGRGQLEERLLRVGYTDEQFEDGSSQRYTVRRERWFRVTAGFPRLLESDLPSGVVDVAFSIAVTACEPHERGEEDVLAILLGGAT